ncbi:hypothetical protein EDWATA_03478 [Edwardsiella tarda ATCC 23685]|uniref:Uncharacterized protein n=1 Tax=Edwardsiella tarda ATCC 23685 TaxID=500638 RepID=D4F9L9_EDWTA|nr:hypothetical protein EDWATA_03478 [Edwardsiella tarda ATCC 23685]
MPQQQNPPVDTGYVYPLRDTSASGRKSTLGAAIRAFSKRVAGNAGSGLLIRSTH